jgi:hypothetical protein
MALTLLFKVEIVLQLEASLVAVIATSSAAAPPMFAKVCQASELICS